MTLGRLSWGRTLSFAKALNLLNLITGSPHPGCRREKILLALYRFRNLGVRVLQPQMGPGKTLE